MGLLKLGNVSLDGTKVHANASRHSAMSYGYAKQWEAKLKAQLAQLRVQAEASNARELPDGLNIPEELARREQRLAAIAAAKEKIEARGPRPMLKPPTRRSLAPGRSVPRKAARGPVTGHRRPLRERLRTKPKPRSIPRACWWWRRP